MRGRALNMKIENAPAMSPSSRPRVAFFMPRERHQPRVQRYLPPRRSPAYAHIQRAMTLSAAACFVVVAEDATRPLLSHTAQCRYAQRSS